MILTGILRHYLTVLLQATPKPLPLLKIREHRSLLRGVNLRTNGSVLTPSSFASRRQYLVSAFKEGAFLADPDARGKPKANPMTDPAAMEGLMSMMKGNVAMMVPQTLIMGWINAFFSGFVISESLFPLLLFHCYGQLREQTSNIFTVKLPFPLTPQFKSMLQSGVGTRDLDVRWVSSLSWYFLTLFGLQPVYNFILGTSNAQAAQAAQMQQMGGAMGAGMGMPGMGADQDPDKLFKAEAENIEVAEVRSVYEGIEGRILAKYAAALPR